MTNATNDTQEILNSGDAHAIATLLTGEPPETDEEIIGDENHGRDVEYTTQFDDDDDGEEGEADDGEEGEADDGEEGEADDDDDGEDLDFDEDEDEDESTVVDDTFEIEFNDEKTTLGEIKAGYIRNADYTKKTQELAAAKEEATHSQGLAIEYLSQEITRYEGMLVDAEKIDLVALANQDPRKFAQVQASIQQIQNKVKSETDRMTSWIAETNQSKQAAKEAIWEKTKVELAETIPGWSPKVAESISKYALEQLGVTKEVLAQTLDAKIIIALDKARRYDAARAKGKAAKEGPRSRAGGKTIKARSTKSGGRSVAKEAKAMAEAQASGNLEEIARLATERQMRKRK